MCACAPALKPLWVQKIVPAISSVGHGTRSLALRSTAPAPVHRDTWDRESIYSASSSVEGWQDVAPMCKTAVTQPCESGKHVYISTTTHN